jgi:hypothetical protein
MWGSAGLQGAAYLSVPLNDPGKQRERNGECYVVASDAGTPGKDQSKLPKRSRTRERNTTVSILPMMMGSGWDGG